MSSRGEKENGKGYPPIEEKTQRVKECLKGLEAANPETEHGQGGGAPDGVGLPGACSVVGYCE